MVNEDHKDASQNDECIVHSHPVPAGELDRYSVDSDAHSEMDIARYVEGQARDETVQHVERMSGNRIKNLRDMGRHHRQGSLVGHHESNQPLFPKPFSKP